MLRHLRVVLSIAAALLIAPTAVKAQYISQSGSVTNGHITCWVTTAIVQDCSSGANSKINALGVVANGGTPLTVSNFLSTNPGGYAQIGLGVSSSAGILSLNSSGGFTQLPFDVIVNGNTAISIAANGTVNLPSGFGLNSLILTGTTSGAVTVKPQAIAGTYNFNLPTTAGTVGQPLISGGGVAAPMTWGALSGNTSTFATTSGSLISGDAVKLDASGNLIDAGGPPATGSVNAGLINQLAYYPASAAAVSGLSTANNGILATNGSGVPAITSTLPTLVQQSISASNITTGTLPCGQLPALSGDTTTSAGSCATTTGHVNGVAYGTSPANNTVPVVTSTNTVTYELVPNASLVNSSITVSGQSCTLGGSCTIPASGLASIGGGTVLGNNTSGGSTPFATIAPVLGIPGTSTGSIGFGASGGNTLTVLPPSSTTAWNMTLPANGGTPNFFLQTNGSGVTTWAAAPGSGTVSSAPAGSIAYYSLTGTTVVGVLDLTFNTGALSLGIANTEKGIINLFGSSSGQITIQPQAGAGTYNFNLPTTAGSSNQPLISKGGGATAMSWGAISGSTSTFATSTGTLTPGDCVSLDGSGNFIDAGGPCTTGGGGGTVSAATAGQFTGYVSSGTVVVGLPNFTFSGATATHGVAGSSTGAVALTGATGGTVTVQPQASFSNYNFNLPTGAGTSGQPLLSGGGAGSPMTFGTLGVAGGGTGLATLTAHAVLLGEGTSTLGFATIGTGGRILVDQGAGADPQFVVMSGGATMNAAGVVTITSATAFTTAMSSAQALSSFGGPF